ncbi:hypothetical protein CHS0354_012042 [Potamilus streckersoni]|nr:hypothetical protein CHS0354_012042 [Potamilus streckersoni]
MGYRVEVYRAEGTTQWYTAVIQSYNHTSKSLVLTDDTVLEEHNEDPSLIQMQLIDDGVVDSILRGVEIGTRRRPRQIKDKEQQQQQQQQQQSATNTKGSCLGSGQSGLASRTSVRKSKQDVGSTTSSSPASGTSVSPALTSTSQQGTDKNDKAGDKSLRSRPQKCDRKKRLEDTIDIVGTKNYGNCSRNRSRSEEGVNSGSVGKKGLDSDSVRSSLESTPTKTSQRTTKEANKAGEVKEKEIKVDKGKSKTKEVNKETSNTEDKEVSFDSSPKKHVDFAINARKSRSPKQKNDKPLPSPVKLDFKSDDKSVGKIPVNSGKNKEKPKEQCSFAKGDIKSESGEKIDKTKTKKPPLSSIKQSSSEKTAKKERKKVIEKVIEKVVETVVKNSTENTLPTACNPSLSESRNSSGVELDNPRKSQDNMHYIKKKQLLLTGGNNSSDKPPTSIPSSANIDVNHSVTDQITKLTRTEKCRVDGEDKSSSTSASVSSSPTCDLSYERADRRDILQDSFRDCKSVRSEINSSINNIHNSNSAFVKVEERSLSRNSQSGRSSSGLSDEIKRSNSHLEDLRSSKQSPSSSPLIVDRSEPVNPYRDPELMRKNPVQSNVQSMLGSHKSSFASVHTPVPIPQQASGLSTSPALSHASSHTPVIPPVGYPPQLLSSMLPHGIPQVDQTTLLHHRLAQQQQLALAQYTSAAQAQLLSMSYPPHGSLNSSQLELIWQQKYPSVPVPPPWLLAKHQEELVRDMALFRERELERERQERERLERDRLERERLERERIERERRQERERQEKERLERMEKEKAERERAERERIEKAEKERLERERRECERQEQNRIEQHKERERLLKESAETLAAVDKHFTESLRLASQRAAQTGMIWPAQSITLGTGKLKSESQTLHPLPSMYVHGSKSHDKDQKSEEKLKQELLREQEYRYSEIIRQQEMWRQRYHQEELIKHHQQLQQQQQEKSLPVSATEQLKTENKGDLVSAALKAQSQDRDVKAHSFGLPSGVKPSYMTSTSSSAIKHENAGKSHGFSLYGYQPFQHSYITTDQLHSYGLDKNKDDKSQIDNKGSVPLPNSPQKKEMCNPPPLIKDNKQQHSSVIVENKLKEALKSSSPQSSHYSPGMHGSSTSPRPIPKPAHSQERFVDKRPEHLPSSSPMGLSQLMSAHRSGEAKSAISSQSQSPLRVASPQQLSSAVMQPMDYRTNPGTNKSPGNSSNSSTNSASVSTAANNVPSSGFVPAVAQPPVSLPPGSVAFTYSLIQQGLVPNPIYSHNSGAGSNKSGDSIRTISVAGTAHVPAVTNAPHPTSNTVTHSGSANQGTKRKNNKDGTNRKKQKGDAINASPNSSSSGNISIPVTTPQILTNPSPYTTTTSSTVSISPTSNTSMAATSTIGSSTVSSVLSSSATASPSSILSQSQKYSTFTGFMDSFKSFVENTVQNAFLQDPELNKRVKTTPDQPAPSSSQSQQQQNQQQQQQQISASQQLEQQQSQVSPHHLQLEQKQQQLKIKTGLERSSTPVSSQRNSGTPLSVNDDATNLSTASSSSHAMSYVETISRVANGQLDTDSDTLSASSPPPQIKSEDNDQSPHKSAKHTKLKKAWLQRHSDEDKEMKNPPPNTTSPSADDGKKDIVRNCYVDVSYINPGKEGGSKSPISSFVLPSNKQVAKMDESTSSASEAETTQVQQEGANQAKKRKTKKERNASTKRSKFDSEEIATSNNSSTRKKSNRRSRESKDKEKGFKDKETDNDDSTNLEEEEKVEPVEEMEEYSPPPLAHSRKDRSKVEGKQHRDSSSPTFHKNMDYSAFGKEKKKNKKNKDKDASDSKDDQGSTKVSETARCGENKSNSLTFGKPLVKASVAHLKKTGEPFLQDDSCSEVTPKLMKCRECKMTPTQRSKKLPNIFCRFYAFRRLRYSQRGFLTIDGFSELTDAEKDDIDPWIPHYPIMEPKLDLKTAKFILSRVGDKFCELVEQEKEAKSWAGVDAKIAWKRAVTGVREMCDVCDTTLFNMHWVCHKCGFVVCLDCYKVETKLVHGDKFVTREEVFLEERQEWLTCSANRQPHDVDKLMLTQIIPNDALWDVGCMVHEMRAKWGIMSKCPCGNQSYSKNGISQNVVQQAIKHLSPSKNKKLVNGVSDDKSKRKNGNIKCSLSGYNPDNTSPLSLLADVASMDSENSRERSESPFSKKKEGEKGGKSYNPITEPVSPITADHEGEKKPASCSTLRELLTKTAGKVKNNESTKKSRSKNSNTLDDIIQSVVEKQLPKEAEFISTENQPMKLMHYTPRLGPSRLLVRDMPILIHNLTETSVLYPEVPHSWLCDGRLLRLHDPRHKGNLKIFQEQWKRGQPVLASGCDKYLNKDLWSPKFFSKHFGSMENDLINCRTGCLVVGQPMKHFWDGFEDMEERLVDEQNNPMLLKLKDWPPGDDFSDILPNHFNDLMHGLPLPEYTHRNGCFNLASRLPDFLVRPDLGPKMYNAYGSADFPLEGTTNLHLDVSDAVNVMVYIGIPDDNGGKQQHMEAALKAIDQAGCDSITKRRVREVNEVPGALWQIFDAVDADKIRDFLNKVAKERGEVIEEHHDPIHDQSWYLDVDLRERLYKEYNVLGYTIIQCMGDAVFIPAGAPHQVRNLNSCIKVAEDFVSPEHLNHCFQLTQEFRHLSDTHSNHEDKLQVKNIIYHAVKDACAVLNEFDPDDDDD